MMKYRCDKCDVIKNTATNTQVLDTMIEFINDMHRCKIHRINVVSYWGLVK